MRMELTGVLNGQSQLLTTLANIRNAYRKIVMMLAGLLSLGLALVCGYLGILYLTGAYVGATVWMPAGFLLLSIECLSIAAYCFH